MRSASTILLQGVPSSVDLEELRQAILDVDGVMSLHELHCWQLSESKIVASVHVLLPSPKTDFMPVASKIHLALHDRGIYSSTIQPEYPRPMQPGEYAVVSRFMNTVSDAHTTTRTMTALHALCCVVPTAN